jgi:hypothetical protein
MPQRIQRKRTKGWRMPPNTVSVTRPGKWGNPYRAGDELTSIPFVDEDYPARHFLTAEQAVENFRDLLTGPKFDQTILQEKWIKPLRGKNLACWCALDKPCHADVLLELANAEEPAR